MRIRCIDQSSSDFFNLEATWNLSHICGNCSFLRATSTQRNNVFRMNFFFVPEIYYLWTKKFRHFLWNIAWYFHTECWNEIFVGWNFSVSKKQQQQNGLREALRWRRKACFRLCISEIIKERRIQRGVASHNGTVTGHIYISYILGGSEGWVLSSRTSTRPLHPISRVKQWHDPNEFNPIKNLSDTYMRGEDKTTQRVPWLSVRLSRSRRNHAPPIQWTVSFILRAARVTERTKTYRFRYWAAVKSTRAKMVWEQRARTRAQIERKLQAHEKKKTFFFRVFRFIEIRVWDW